MESPPQPGSSARGTRLLLELGRGGMGIVYLALAHGHGGFTKLKVVKRLRPDIADDPRARQMFLDEAKLAARLLHPNIVQTNEVGFDGKHYFMEMEYLEGQSFDALQRRAGGLDVAIPLDTQLWIITQTLAGLHHAHEQRDLNGTPLNVVHRDVSPHNVFLTYDGAVKVLDFGIAKAADTQSETTTGVVKGKATYMAPEQAAHKPTDRRADIFACGVMLWQAVTGQRLWAGMNDFQIYVKLTEGTIPSPRSVQPEVSEALDAICVKALAPAAANRYGTAAEMQSAIEDHLEATGTKAGPKTVAKLLGELFAERRAQVQAEIEARSKGAPTLAATAEIPELAPPSMTPGTAGFSGQSRTTTESRQESKRTRFDRRFRRATLAATGVLIVASGVLAAVALRNKAAKTAAGAEDAAGAALGPRECAKNAECMRSHGGEPWVCRKDRGKCMPLTSEDCTIVSEPGDVENDRTVWFGTMLPTTAKFKAEDARILQRGIELARHDFMTEVKGLPSPQPNAPPRPIGLVTCNDSEQTLRPARHLADAGVAAVIGFGSSGEVVEIANQVFIPSHTPIFVGLGISQAIASVPQPPEGPRFLYRTTLSALYYQAPISLFLLEVIEPLVQKSKVVGPDAPMRVALVRRKESASLSIADRISSTLLFNGKSVVENEDNYRTYAFDEQKPLETIAAVVDFRPHAVIIVGSNTIIEGLERAWKNARYRPYYVSPGSLINTNSDLMKLIGSDVDRRRRFFGVAPPAKTMANFRLVDDYNALFSEKINGATSPASTYDAFYVAAYAAFASGRDQPTGPDVAAAVTRLIPPGRAVDVGPTRISEAITEISATGRIDLNGVGSSFDFDPATGDAPGDLAIVCVGIDADTKLASDGIDSGMIYDARAHKLVGAMHCP